MKRIKILIASLCIISIVLVVSVVLPGYLKKKLEAQLAHTCPRCQFHIGSLQFNPFGSVFSGQDVSYVGDTNATPVIRVTAEKIKVSVAILKLIRHNVEISYVVLSNIKIVIEEKYNPHKPAPEANALQKLKSSYGGKWLESLPAAKIDSLRIENGTLEYVLKIFGKEARISVSDIDADISQAGTRRDLGPRFVDVNLKGRLQKSGLVLLNCKVDLFSVKNQDKIEIDVQHQKMADLNSFFVNEDGIEMGGELEKGHASLGLSQGRLSGHLAARYRDLSLHIMPTPETGKIEAALTNFFQKMKMAKTKPDPREPFPQADVSYERRAGQGLIKFILQGLKEAALKVTSH